MLPIVCFPISLALHYRESDSQFMAKKSMAKQIYEQNKSTEVQLMI